MNKLFINSIGHYIPHHIINNAHFTRNFGILEEDIVARSGILERRKALQKENTNTMGSLAVSMAVKTVPYPAVQVDLVIGATYTPYDTVGTLAHTIQKEYQIARAKTFTISSACSSLCNALEIVESFFTTGKAEKALVVASEHNTANVDEGDKASGFLWGDGAAALFISKERYSEQDLEILDISSNGLGHIGKSTQAVFLRPSDGGIKMPYGRDVFLFACKYMQEEAENIIHRNHLTIQDLDWLIPHQANLRIIDHVRQSMGLRENQVIVNLDKLGNTGCASAAIGLSQNYEKFEKGNIIVITVFGGGYSSGAVLMRK